MADRDGRADRTRGTAQSAEPDLHDPEDAFLGDILGEEKAQAIVEEFDEQLAHDILAAMFEHRSDLVAAHPEAENLTLESAVQNSPLPFHPGALRFYEEQGITVGATPAATPGA